MTMRMAWIPVVLLSLGVAASAGSGVQRTMPLRAPLGDVVPLHIDGLAGTDQTVSENEQRIAGMDQYLLRSYTSADPARAGFSVYVGYYEYQTRGHTIHSPKNCLPGAGWEPLTSSVATVTTAAGAVEVTRYLLQRNDERAVVLYWYQGRGRIENNEYAVKWHLLRDAAFRRRSDEALVRIVVPVIESEDASTATATRIAAIVMSGVSLALHE